MATYRLRRAVVPTKFDSEGRTAYLPALDGVRALAVIAVLLYHLEGAPLAGGFLGVSTFFTLSGFLITTLLLDEHESNGTISLLSFWKRRWRRLLPAALACLALVVVVSAAHAFVPAQRDDVRDGVPWALGNLANWHQLWHGGGYLADLAAPSPLEHFWSLAIEEQFYAAFPLVVAVTMSVGLRRGGQRLGGRRRLGVLLAALMTGSVLLGALAGWTSDRVYLGTDTRIAEILVGALLAVLLTRGLAGPVAASIRAFARIGGLVALAALVLAWWLVSDSDRWLYRGGFGAYAVVSGVVVLGALVPGPLQGLLATRPLVAVGRVSYGAYLYHWPVFLWLTSTRTGLDGFALTATRLAVTAGLTVASFALVEDPIRRRRTTMQARHVLTSRPVLVGVASVSLLLGAAALPREAPVDIAGLDAGGESVPDEPPPPVASVPPPSWKVLLVVDERSAELVSEVRASAPEVGNWEVAGVARLDCPDMAAGVPCAWEQDWPGALADADADAAVLLIDTWDYRPSVAGQLPASGTTSVEAIDWAALRFTQGIDLLAAGDRPVLWVSWPVDPAGGTRQDLADTAWSLERRVTAARPGLVRVPVSAPSPSEIATVVGTHSSAAVGDGTNVMVVGDSVAGSLAAGLAEWGRDHGVSVWDNSRGGCGAIRGGRRVWLDGSLLSEDECRPWREDWVNAATRWEADVVVVLVGVWDVADREVPGHGAVVTPGDPVWDTYVASEYAALLGEFDTVDTTIVLVTPPCMGYAGERVPGGLGGGHPVFAGDRQRSFAQGILPAAIEGHENAEIYDLFSDLCPNGRFEELKIGDELVRPDGVHFGSVGSVWWAGLHGADLVG